MDFCPCVPTMCKRHTSSTADYVKLHPLRDSRSDSSVGGRPEMVRTQTREEDTSGDCSEAALPTEDPRLVIDLLTISPAAENFTCSKSQTRFVGREVGFDKDAPGSGARFNSRHPSSVILRRKC